MLSMLNRNFVFNALVKYSHWHLQKKHAATFFCMLTFELNFYFLLLAYSSLCTLFYDLACIINGHYIFSIHLCCIVLFISSVCKRLAGWIKEQNKLLNTISTDKANVYLSVSSSLILNSPQRHSLSEVVLSHLHLLT